MTRHSPNATRTAWLCFVASGAAGLVYETCWVRLASLAFGSTTVALSTVLAVFFAGLAAGSELFGRWAQRARRPLRVYAALEIGLAVLAMLSPTAFEVADSLYGAVYRAIGDRPALLVALRATLICAILLPPTVLMGGTFPLFCRQFVRSEGTIGRSVGLLYATNTLGAAAGCALTGYVLLPTLGVHGALACGAALSGAAGIAVWSLRVEGPPPAVVERATPADRPRVRTVAWLFFASGLVAVGSQVVWTRFLALLVSNTVWTYTLTLTVVLVGIVLGSALAARLADRARDTRAVAFGALQIAIGLSLLLTVLLPPPVWQALGGGIATRAALILPVATLSGASFPLAIRMVLDDPRQAGAGAGRMTAINTLGGIIGALLIGFLGLPHLGTAASAQLLAAISVASGALAWWTLTDRRPLLRVATGAAAVAWLVIPWAIGTRVPADFLAPRSRLVDWTEGWTSNLSVTRNDGVLQLDIDRWWQGTDVRSHQIMAAHLPMLLHPAPRDVLVVGVGTGQAPSRFSFYDVERLDCVDIEPALFGFVPRHFDSTWMQDPAVRLLREDGRHYITHTARSYDVISLEIGQLFRAGAASFYTEQFYRRAAARLRRGGLLSQFVPLPFLEVETFKRLLRTFAEVFPECSLWYNSSELLIVGVIGDRARLSADRLRLVESEAAIRDDLRYSHWGGRAEWLQHRQNLLAMFLCGPRGVHSARRRRRAIRRRHPGIGVRRQPRGGNRSAAARDCRAAAAERRVGRRLRGRPRRGTARRGRGDARTQYRRPGGDGASAPLQTTAPARRRDGSRRIAAARRAGQSLEPRGAARAGPRRRSGRTSRRRAGAVRPGAGGGT